MRRCRWCRYRMVWWPFRYCADCKSLLRELGIWGVR